MRLIRFTILLTVLLIVFVPRKSFAQPDTIRTDIALKAREVSTSKATLLAAAFPGMGQVYNRKYWKIPIVYAGFGALGYSIVFNSQNYNKYIEAYRDLNDGIPETKSYAEVVLNFDPGEIDQSLGSDLYDPQTSSWVSDQLLNAVNYYRRYKELSYIGVVAWYLISILDAHIDANLYDYDVSENLNLSIEAVPVSMAFGKTVGIGIKLTF